MKFPFEDQRVASMFASYPKPARTGLLTLRDLIFETAEQTPGVGRLEETLKWNQPAYLTPGTKSGSTIRLGLAGENGFAIYAHCQTSILSDFQNVFPDDFVYHGNRAIEFSGGETLALEKLELLIRSALTYHLARRKKTGT